MIIQNVDRIRSHGDPPALTRVLSKETNQELNTTTVPFCASPDHVLRIIQRLANERRRSLSYLGPMAKGLLLTVREMRPSGIDQKIARQEEIWIIKNIPIFSPAGNFR
jgi:hypothetical protein